MKNSAIALGASLVFVSTLGSAAVTPAKTIGPFDDLHVRLPQIVGIFVHNTTIVNGKKYWDNSTTQWYIIWPQDKSGAAIPDGSSALRAVAYVTSNSDKAGRSISVITTIYGEDLNPTGDGLKITGFTADNPEAVTSNESFIGKSGKVYKAGPAALVALSDLAGFLGDGFDLSPFVGDPSSAVYVFQTTIPDKQLGSPSLGSLLSESFASSYPAAGEETDGAYDPGTLPSTQFAVTAGNVDIMGVDNQVSGSCTANPSGNCLDLIGNAHMGAIASLRQYDLDPGTTYTIQFTVVAQDVKSNLDFTVGLGAFSSPVTATPKKQLIRLYYTPTSIESMATLNFASVTDVDGEHGPVLSNIALCAHRAGSKNLKCATPK
jgi:hypothetical protein